LKNNSDNLQKLMSNPEWLENDDILKFLAESVKEDDKKKK
jgi:hypothetical protein